MRISILLTLIVFQFSYSQKITIDISLSKIIDETSGLEIIDGQFVNTDLSSEDSKKKQIIRNGYKIWKRFFR